MDHAWDGFQNLIAKAINQHAGVLCLLIKRCTYYQNQKLTLYSATLVGKRSIRRHDHDQDDDDHLHSLATHPHVPAHTLSSTDDMDSRHMSFQARSSRFPAPPLSRARPARPTPARTAPAPTTSSLWLPSTQGARPAAGRTSGLGPTGAAEW
ncbi:hypothetical protein Pelo_18608 [Pelomyxa schiedti]|nr:hypothetical protein Pelo_18608 [Pelomyxa schiedti]